MHLLGNHADRVSRASDSKSGPVFFFCLFFQPDSTLPSALAVHVHHVAQRHTCRTCSVYQHGEMNETPYAYTYIRSTIHSMLLRWLTQCRFLAAHHRAVTVHNGGIRSRIGHFHDTPSPRTNRDRHRHNQWRLISMETLLADCDGTWNDLKQNKTKKIRSFLSAFLSFFHSSTDNLIYSLQQRIYQPPSQRN